MQQGILDIMITRTRSQVQSSMTVLGFHDDPELKIFIYSYLDMHGHI